MARSTAYSHTFRVLLCKSCGAPLELPVQGGAITCRYCGAAMQWGRRNETRAQPRMDEAVRFDRLRQQDGAPPPPPPGLESYVSPLGGLVPQYAPAAFAEWQRARAEVGAGAPFGTQDRFFFLTVLLAELHAEQDRHAEARAMCETASEILSSDRHRQMLRCLMARGAARLGDLQGGEDWLAACDPYSDDLLSDSAYRFARAYVDTARGDFGAVLRMLGPRSGDVPIADSMDAICVVLRANAHERTGNLQAAVGELSGSLSMRGMSLAALERAAHASSALGLCPQSLPLARRASAAESQPSASRNALSSRAGIAILAVVALPGILIGGGFLVAAFLAPKGATTDDGFPLDWFFLGMGACFLTSFSAAPAIMLPMIIAQRRKVARLAARGVDTVAQLLSIERTNVEINGVPQFALTLRVFLPDRAPYDIAIKETLALEETQKLHVGSNVNVRVDPDDPGVAMLGAVR